jgi:hypothetical protein
MATCSLSSCVPRNRILAQTLSYQNNAHRAIINTSVREPPGRPAATDCYWLDRPNEALSYACPSVTQHPYVKNYSNSRSPEAE